MKKSDVLIIGAGHNGLIAATILARKGLSVTLLEEKGVVGGHPGGSVSGAPGYNAAQKILLDLG